MNKQSLNRKVISVSDQLKKHKATQTNKNKYNAKRVEVDGIKFDSKKEARRYSELKLMQRAGIISELKTQVFFQLVPSNKRERGVSYVADFTYIENGVLVVEDTKSKATKTPTYIVKRKLMLEVHGIIINEI